MASPLGGHLPPAQQQQLHPLTHRRAGRAEGGRLGKALSATARVVRQLLEPVGSVVRVMLRLSRAQHCVGSGPRLLDDQRLGFINVEGGQAGAGEHVVELPSFPVIR